MSDASPADKPPRYQLYHFFLHRCVLARSEDEARRIAASEWATSDGELYTITAVDQAGHIYAEGTPEKIACAPEIAGYFEDLLNSTHNLRDPGHEERFFTELDRFNRAMSDIREAMLQPSTVPIDPSFELDGTELVGFCLSIAGGDD